MCGKEGKLLASQQLTGGATNEISTDYCGPLKSPNFYNDPKATKSARPLPNFLQCWTSPWCASNWKPCGIELEAQWNRIWNSVQSQPYLPCALAPDVVCARKNRGTPRAILKSISAG